MANLILRPIDDGLNDGWSGTPSSTLWDNIADHDPDGDGSYVYTDIPDSYFTCLLSDTSSRNFPRPERIRGVTIIATVRSTLVFPATRFKFRISYYGVDYDSEDIFSTNLVTYREFFQTLLTAPNGDAFTNQGLKDMRVGLVYVDGPAIRCTKLETQVHHETYPNLTLGPDGNGADQSWNLNPDTTQAYMCVQGPYDGDLSYVFSNTPGDRSTFTMEDLPPALTPPAIDRIVTNALVKNYGLPGAQGYVVLSSGGTPYKGATSDLPLPIPDDGKWHIWSQSFLNDPAVAWPSGSPLATPWTPAELSNAEIGVEVDSGNIRCTSLMADVWLKYAPISSLDLFPDGNGDLIDLPPLVPNAGESAWEDIDEDPPDDAGSYIGGDADAFNRAMFGTFTVPAVGPIPAGERINNVELRFRLRLGGSSSTVVGALVRNPATQDTYISEPQTISGTATTWFDVVVNLATNPISGDPWASSTDVSDLQYGLVIFSGDCWLSRLRVQIQTTLDIRATPDPTDLELTSGALALMTRSLTDGTVYAVTEFSVGKGGYAPAAPATTLPVNPADTALSQEIFRARIMDARSTVTVLSGKVSIAAASNIVTGTGTHFLSEATPGQYLNIAGEVLQILAVSTDTSLSLTAPHVAGATLVEAYVSPRVVDYFCRIPHGEAVEGIGEVGLWATIFQSPFPAEIGTSFLFALQHMPCQCRHQDSVSLFRLRLNYP